MPSGDNMWDFMGYNGKLSLTLGRVKHKSAQARQHCKYTCSKRGGLVSCDLQAPTNPPYIAHMIDRLPPQTSILQNRGALPDTNRMGDLLADLVFSGEISLETCDRLAATLTSPEVLDIKDESLREILARRLVLQVRDELLMIVPSRCTTIMQSFPTHPNRGH
jgi:hypothetical protein